MRANGLPSTNRGYMQCHAQCLASALVLALVMLASCGADSSDAAVSHDLRRFFEAFVGRDLSAGELESVTKEFIELHSLYGRTPSAIRDIAEQLSASARELRSDAAGPAALMVRHALLTTNYLNADLHGTLQLRLLTEPDPVCVVDVRSRRLMTQRDVIALANLHRFARSNGAPRHEELSRQQIDELIVALRATVGGNSGSMPQLYGEAAAFWAGVQREWPKLDSNQKSMTRAYAARMWRVQLPVEMYGRLWGLSPKAANQRQADDISYRIAAITDINVRLGNLARVMDALFGP
jgi:hypothetical protein